MPTRQTQRERDENRRQERLAEVDRQVDDGSLVIRQMTDAERERFPAPDKPRPPRRRWQR